MKIQEFLIKSHQCHCEPQAKQSRYSALSGIAPSSYDKTLHNDKAVILALGAESAGNFSIFHKEKIYFSNDFGDLLEDTNFNKFKNKLNEFLKKNNIKPKIILTDLHPLYKTTLLGAELAKKFRAKHIQVQHHIAHIFSSIGEYVISNNQFPISKQIPNSKFQIQNSFFGIALDGTGYGLDGKIWGGEIFEFRIKNYELRIKRTGHLENQIMIGGDLAIKEPARMLIAILAKITNYKLQITNKSKIKNSKSQKDFIYKYVKKYYTCNQFELLYNQLQNNFNCQETSSTGRILDAVSLLLGFCENKRNYKHEPVELLKKNSTIPYSDLKPQITFNFQLSTFNLLTTPLFEYLIKNFHRDKRRLAATAQLYIAEGLHQIILKSKFLNPKSKMFLAGGIGNNKIISSYLKSKGFYANKKIYPVKAKFNGVPRGDAGISFGQIVYYLFKK